jgi:hypothetical protein
MPENRTFENHSELNNLKNNSLYFFFSREMISTDYQLDFPQTSSLHKRWVLDLPMLASLQLSLNANAENSSRKWQCCVPYPPTDHTYIHRKKIQTCILSQYKCARVERLMS